MMWREESEERGEQLRMTIVCVVDVVGKGKKEGREGRRREAGVASRREKGREVGKMALS